MLSRGASLARLLGPGRLAAARSAGASQPCRRADAIVSPLTLLSRYGTHTLDGRNIFQLRAAAAPVQEAKATPFVPIDLPTSDESERLLRIRHSVSARPTAANRAPHVSVSRKFDTSLAFGRRSARTSWRWRCSAYTRARR